MNEAEFSDHLRDPAALRLCWTKMNIKLWHNRVVTDTDGNDFIRYLLVLTRHRLNPQKREY